MNFTGPTMNSLTSLFRRLLLDFFYNKDRTLEYLCKSINSSSFFFNFDKIFVRKLTGRIPRIWWNNKLFPWLLLSILLFQLQIFPKIYWYLIPFTYIYLTLLKSGIIIFTYCSVFIKTKLDQSQKVYKNMKMINFLL